MTGLNEGIPDEILDSPEEVTPYNKELMYDYAMQAQASYDFYNKGLEFSQEKLDSYYGKDKRNIIPEFSDNNSIVIHNKDNDSYTISYRGSQDIHDFGLPDVAIALGIRPYNEHANITPNTSRFVNAEKKFDDIREKFPDKKIVTTGHSLGGTQSIYVSNLHNDVEAYGFNAGGSPLDIVRHAIFNQSNDRVTHYHTSQGDFVSNSIAFFGDKFFNHKVISVKVPSPEGSDKLPIADVLYYHGLSNFLPENIKAADANSVPVVLVKFEPRKLEPLERKIPPSSLDGIARYCYDSRVSLKDTLKSEGLRERSSIMRDEGGLRGCPLLEEKEYPVIS